MNTLILDLQVKILQISELPIDTYLYYKKQFPSLLPKKMKLSSEFVDSLNTFFTKRVKHYKRKIELETSSNKQYSCYLDIMSKTLNQKRLIEIMVDYDEDQVKMAIRVFRVKKETSEMWTIRKIVCNIQTGEPTNDWMADSDSDYDF